jgi:feruloyl esterase
MIERMVVEHGLDRSRIYVTGLSAGGAMAAVMLATYPEVFAGGAIVAGLPFGIARNVQEALDAMFQGGSRSAEDLAGKVRAASPHKGSWPRISVWHGSADATVRLSNAGEIEKQWAGVHGLAIEPDESHKVDGQVRRVWRNAAGEPVLESYTIAGMAHGTPIAAALGADGGSAAPFILEAGIGSSIRIAEFWGLTRAAGRPKAASGQADGVSKDVIHLPGPRQAAGAKPPAKKAAQAHSRAAKRHGGTEGRFGLDPQAVIEKALRAAGLLKR